MELLDRADHRDGLIGPLRQKHESVSGYFFCSFEFLFINYDNSPPHKINREILYIYVESPTFRQGWMSTVPELLRDKPERTGLKPEVQRTGI
jgi:hypothetical protein